MKLETNSVGIESIGTPTTQVTGGMKSKNLAKFIDLITVQAYSNPEGSIVRELTSNCFDAHVKWGKRIGIEYNEPVVVMYSEEEGQGYISFIDKGTGLSPTEMREIYIDIGTSDKEEDNDFIGCYGVGSKSFLSYTPSIDLITVVDNIKYHYIVYKNGEGLLSYDLLLQTSTEDRNGTEVKMNIGALVFDEYNGSYCYRAKDYEKFRNEIIKQLYYFDSVLVVGFGLDNDYSIYEADIFKIRNGDNPFKEMHLISGKVNYPIDWNVLGREPLKIPVGVKFNIGELQVTVSRENIRYEEREKNKLINSRIDEVVEEIRKRYNKTSTSVDTLEEFLKHRDSPNKLLIVEDVEIILPKKQALNKAGTGYKSVDVIEGLNEVKWKPLAHLPIEIPKDPYFIFKLKSRISVPDKKGNSVLISTSENEDNNIFNTVVKYQNSVYRIKGDRDKTKDQFLWWKHKVELPLLITKAKGFNYVGLTKLFDLGDQVTKKTTNKYTLADRKKIRIPITEIVKGKSIFYGKTYLIQEYKKAITKDLVSRSQSYEKVELSNAYLSELQLQKLARKRPKLEGKIIIYDLVNGNSNTSVELDLKTLNGYKGFIIYGEKDKLKELRGVKDMLSNIEPYKSTQKSKLILVKPIQLVDGDTVDEDTGEIIIGLVLKKTTFRYGNNPIGRTVRLGDVKLRDVAGRIFITAKSNHKLLNDNPYFMHIETFMSNGNRMFRNSVTAWYIRRELDDIRENNTCLLKYMERINKKLHDSITDLHSWSSKNWSQYYVNEEFMENCLVIGKESGFLWDDKIQLIEKIKSWFSSDLAIFNNIDSKTFEDEVMFKDIIALLKMKHKRLSPEHYFVPNPVEEKILEEAKELIEYKLSLEPMVKKLLIYNNKRKQA